MPDKLKPFYARQMEVYAGFSENADHNVGRVIDAIEELGELDNTLVIWIWGDNGASMEGTVTGSFNELTMQNGIPLTDEMQLQLSERYGGMDAWGAEIMAPHYGAAWAWAGNTPFQWGKQVGSHLGGTRNPMVIHWPGHVPAGGALRSQFTHVIDIAPTILDIAGIPAPATVDGIEQQPMHGVSFKDTLAAADAPERHTQQYFESVGNRSMYKDGWWLSMRTARIPWVLTPQAIMPYCAGRLGPGRGPDRALLPARRLQPGARPGSGAPGEGGRAPGALLAGGRALPGAAAPGHPVLVLRPAAAAAREHQARVPGRRPERPLGHDAARLQPLLHDQRRPRRAGRAAPRASSWRRPTTSVASRSSSRTAS